MDSKVNSGSQWVVWGWVEKTNEAEKGPAQIIFQGQKAGTVCPGFVIFLLMNRLAVCLGLHTAHWYSGYCEAAARQTHIWASALSVSMRYNQNGLSTNRSKWQHRCCSAWWDGRWIRKHRIRTAASNLLYGSYSVIWCSDLFVLTEYKQRQLQLTATATNGEILFLPTYPLCFSSYTPSALLYILYTHVVLPCVPTLALSLTISHLHIPTLTYTGETGTFST